MNTVKIVIDYFNVTLEILLAMFFFSGFAKRRVSKSVMTVIVFVLSFVFMGAITVAGNGTMMGIISLVITLLVALCYDFKLYNAVLNTILLSLMVMAAEIILSFLLLLTGAKTANVEYSIYTYIIGIVSSKFISLLLVLLMHRGNHKMLQSAKGNNFLGILLMPVASLISIVLFYQMLSYDITDRLKVIIVAALVLLIVANVIIFYVVDRQYELISARQRLKASDALLDNQRQYYDEVFESQKEVRKIRHNLKGIFYSVLSKMDSGDLDGAREAMVYQLSDTSKNLELSDKKNANVIDSILYAKTEEAKCSQIDLRAVVRINTDIKISHLDIAIMLANLLDNAIEATQLIEKEEDRVIELTIVVDQVNMMVTLSNPVLVNANIKRLQSKKKDKKNHGYGVLTITAIAQKYNGDCKMSCEHNVFESVIFMQNEEME